MGIVLYTANQARELAVVVILRESVAFEECQIRCACIRMRLISMRDSILNRDDHVPISRKRRRLATYRLKHYAGGYHLYGILY